MQLASMACGNCKSRAALLASQSEVLFLRVGFDSECQFSFGVVFHGHQFLNDVNHRAVRCFVHSSLARYLRSRDGDFLFAWWHARAELAIGDRGISRRCLAVGRYKPDDSGFERLAIEGYGTGDRA